MDYDFLNKAKCGETTTVTSQQLCDLFAEDIDNQPTLCCVADLQSWCTTFNITLSYNSATFTYTLTPNA